MSRKSLIRKSPSPSPENPAIAADNRRHLPLIPKDPSKRCASLAEAAGTTAAGCTVLCCCLPYGLLHLLVVGLKLPAALMRRRRQRWARAKGGVRKPKAGAFRDEIDHGLYDGVLMARSSSEETWPTNSPSPEIVELDREMSAIFQSTGFWRSLSQRKRAATPLSKL